MPLISKTKSRYYLIHPFPKKSTNKNEYITFDFYDEEEMEYWYPILNYIEKLFEKLNKDGKYNTLRENLIRELRKEL